MTNSEISCLSSSTCSPIRGMELSITCRIANNKIGGLSRGSDSIKVNPSTRWQYCISNNTHESLKTPEGVSDGLCGVLHHSGEVLACIGDKTEIKLIYGRMHWGWHRVLCLFSYSSGKKPISCKEAQHFPRFYSMLEQKKWNVTEHLHQKTKTACPRPRLMINHTSRSLETEVINSFIFKTHWEGKCGHANLIFQANCYFSACVASEWVPEQQQQIKRDSLCKHYVGYKPHPLPSTIFFFK